MPQRRRPTTAAALALLLLTLLFAPLATGPTAAAHPARTPVALAQPHQDLRPHADATGSGGSCRPLDLPVKGAEVVLAHGQPDPLATAGAARTPLAQAHPAPAGPSRAPPPPVAGRAALLPVLRI
ncbi:hypothetical protein ACIHFE_00380 [Streptomyces sp. NPDC052396]|uniref:hypothetical protein n=1 Tax=Streptomyces sp. NPDC052396 TaxID=3365689 RepID=UPI0037D6A002